MRLLAILFLVLGVAFILNGLAYWWENPRLTEMQVFQERGVRLLAGLGLIACSYKIFEDRP